jgi:hypothetical protein
MKPVCIIFFLFCEMDVFSQTGKVPGDLLKNTITLKVNRQLAEGFNFPFSSIKVLDCRQDTTKIGFIEKGVGRTPYKKLIVENGFQKSGEIFYNQYYQNCLSGDSNQLLIVAKKFWVNRSAKRNIQRRNNTNNIDNDFDLYVQFDYFLKRRDEFMPIKRIDTIFSMGRNYIKAEYESYRENDYSFYEFVLIKMIEAVDYKFYSDRFQISRNRKKLDAVLNFYKTKMEYPILKDSIYKKGIYMSFNEFRNNRPSIENFKVEQNKKAGKLLFTSKNDSSIEVIKYWGYCDGKDIFCYDLSHPVQRVGNTFEFFAESKVIRYYSTGTPNTIYGEIPRVNFYTREKVYEPHQFDMETGNDY